MKKYTITAFILMICVFVFAADLYAQPLLPKGKWWKHPEVLTEVDLSDDQIQEIEKISDEGMRKIIKLKADLEIASMDLETLLDQVEQQKLDLNALERQIDIVNKVRGELGKERILMLAKVRNVLPKDKIEKLKKMRGRFRKEMRGQRCRQGTDREVWEDRPQGQGGEE